MWWHQTPKTNAERAEEIAQLTKKRENLLDRAPEAVLIRQAVVVCFLGPTGAFDPRRPKQPMA
jgi:hypothetical protein